LSSNEKLNNIINTLRYLSLSRIADWLW